MCCCCWDKGECKSKFDNGLDRCFSHLVQKVNLKRKSSINLIYSAFEGGRSSNHSSGVYEVKVDGAFGGNANVVTFTVLEVTTIFYIPLVAKHSQITMILIIKMGV